MSSTWHPTWQWSRALPSMRVIASAVLLSPLCAGHSALAFRRLLWDFLGFLPWSRSLSMMRSYAVVVIAPHPYDAQVGYQPDKEDLRLLGVGPPRRSGRKRGR